MDVLILLVGAIFAISISKAVKKESSKNLIFIVSIIGVMIFDFYQVMHKPGNMQIIASYQAIGKNYFNIFFDVITNNYQYKWYTWLFFIILIPWYGFEYFKNKQKENKILNAILQLLNAGKKQIDLDIISNQVNIDRNDISKLFYIYQENGQISHDVYIIDK